jgi:pyruvate dehydrogenase E2 component (dihydrolipoamide acetyltransferase)
VPSEIYGLVIPKYGMVMTEGVISKWHLHEGDTVNRGDELVDIETEKVANVYESPHTGILRRRLVPEGRPAPIGALFGIIAARDVDDVEIDSYIEKFQSAFSVTDTSSGGASAEVVDIPGGYIRFLKQGDGAAAATVLIHGFGANLNNWLLNQAMLAESRSAYAIDLPGHGGSMKNPQFATIDDMATAVFRFLDAKNLLSIHLVGHSLGGGVAAKIAVETSALVKSLTLIAPVGLGREINFPFIKGLVEIDRRKDMQSLLQTLFHDPALVSRDMTMGVLNAKRIDGAVTCLRSIAESCFSGGQQTNILRGDLMRLSVPTQVIWGESDRIIPPQHAANLPQSMSVHLVERAGHMVHMERAAEVNKLISHFVEAI